MRLSFIVYVIFLVLPLGIYAQNNSPWKNLTSQNVSGVYYGLGRHEYSLTGGQGFSVYLKNTSSQTVTVTGTLVAKTICGNEVSTNFSTLLNPGQVANGGNFGSGNSQTGVVTEADCKGVRYAQTNYINRIKDVRIDNLNVAGQNVNNLKTNSNIIVAQNNVQPPVAVNTAPANSYPKINQDSLINAQNSLQKTKDSLLAEINNLEKKKRDLQSDLNKPQQNTPVQNTNVVNEKNQNNNSQNVIVQEISTPLLSDQQTVAAEPKVKISTIAINNYQNTTTKSVYNKQVINSKRVIINFQMGIGWDIIPIVINNNNGNSSTGVNSHPVLQVGCKFTIPINSIFSTEVNPFLSYGFNTAGGNGHFMEYGGCASFLGRLGHNSPVQLSGSIGYVGRNGNWQINNSNNRIQEADYNYGLLKYGFGMRFTINKKLWIQPGIFWNHGTFTPSDINSATVESLDMMIKEKWMISINYSGNYPSVGSTNYLYNFMPGNQNYFSLRFLYNLKMK